MKSLSNRDSKLNSLSNINEFKNSKHNHKIKDIDLISPNNDKINISNKSISLNKRSNSTNKVNLKYQDSNLNSQSKHLLSADINN